MSKLLAYMNLLDKDAAASLAHSDDPIAAMAGFGLTDAEQSAIMSGDKDAVAKITGANSVDGKAPQVTNSDF